MPHRDAAVSRRIQNISPVMNLIAAVLRSVTDTFSHVFLMDIVRLDRTAVERITVVRKAAAGIGAGRDIQDILAYPFP